MYYQQLICLLAMQCWIITYKYYFFRQNVQFINNLSRNIYNYVSKGYVTSIQKKQGQKLSIRT